MKKIGTILVLALIVTFISIPCMAQEKTFRIEILQVTDNDPFDLCYSGFIKELESNGLIEGQNLTINKRVIPFDVEKGGLWKKMGVLMQIRKEASKIVNEKPDLVLAVGTAATKYSKEKIIAAGIPLVFTAVAIPEAAGCKSLKVAGPGFTGATLYMDINDFLKILHLAFPDKKTYGIIHTEDDNALAQIAQLNAAGQSMGLTFLTKEVHRKDSLIPAAKELIGSGVEAFLLPIDTYYGMRNNEPCRELVEITLAPKIPLISMMHYPQPGASLYVGTDFAYVGSLAAQNIVKILKEGASPDHLPVLHQDDLSIMVDVDRLKKIDLELPLQILQLAKDSRVYYNSIHGSGQDIQDKSAAGK